MKQPKIFYQFNYPNVMYSNKGDKSRTVKTSGCGIVCTAMMLAEFVDAKITPLDTCKMSLENGFRRDGEGTLWSFFPWLAKKYNLGFEQTGDTKKALEALEKGALVVCSMGPGEFTSEGHFILAYGIDCNKVYVNDPNSSKRTGKGFYDDIFRHQCKQYFIFKRPVTKEIALEDAIALWSKTLLNGKPVIGSPGDMLQEFKNGKITTSRINAFLIKAANYIDKDIKCIKDAVYVWVKVGVVGSPADMLKEFENGSLTPARFEAFLIKSAKYIRK